MKEQLLQIKRRLNKMKDEKEDKLNFSQAILASSFIGDNFLYEVHSPFLQKKCYTVSKQDYIGTIMERVYDNTRFQAIVNHDKIVDIPFVTLKDCHAKKENVPIPYFCEIHWEYFMQKGLERYHFPREYVNLYAIYYDLSPDNLEYLCSVLGFQVSEGQIFNIQTGKLQDFSKCKIVKIENELEKNYYHYEELPEVFNTLKKQLK